MTISVNLVFGVLCLTSTVASVNFDPGVNVTTIDWPPVRNHTDVVAETGRNGTGRAISGFNSTNVANRILVILKLLQLANSVVRQNSTNSTASESRSLMSWFRVRKPSQRQEGPYVHRSNFLFPTDFHDPPHRPHHHHHHSHHPHRHHYIPSSSFQPFPKLNHDPNSLLFMPSVTDAGAIDYWLKLIEDAKLMDDPSPLMIGRNKASPLAVRPQRFRPLLKPHSRIRNGGIKIQPGERKVIKVKHYPDQDYADDDEEQEEPISNDIPKDTKQQYSSKQSNKRIEFDASPRCDKFTDDICIDDFEYPEHAILDEIYKRKDIFQLMYSEVKSDAPLVDGIPRDMDENFSSDYYYSNNEHDSEDYENYPHSNKSSTLNSDQYDYDQADQAKVERRKKNGGFVCRSEVLYAKPKLARNIRGKWRVIVNAGEYTQTVRMEKCIRPNSECRFIADHKYESRCAQISSIHRLLVFEKGKGFYIDTFRIPTACTCHVYSAKYPRNKSKLTENRYSDESASNIVNVKRNKPKSNLGDTLWSLLAAENSKSKTQTRLNAQNQVEILKMLPQLSSIAPEKVLKQLLDEYADLKDAQRLTTGEYANDQYEKRKHQLSYQAKPGMTTIVTPTGGNPVVQVIHVPVSSGIVTTTTDEPENSSGNRMQPIYRNNQYSKSGSKLSKYFVTNNQRILESSATTVNTTHYTASPLEVESKENEEPPSSGNIKKLLNKKMNFSYHPILEYIIN